MTAPGVRGFSLAELIVVMAIIGILAALGMPTFLSYWKSSTLRAGTQEVTALLNAARQLAIKENQSACVKGDQPSTTYGTKVRVTLGSCLTTGSFCSSSVTTNCIWRGAGTDSEGYVTLANAMQLRVPAADVVFTYLGAASPAGTFYVCNPSDTGSRARIVVAASGRISTAYETGTACSAS